MMLAFITVDIRRYNRINHGVRQLPYSLVTDYLHHGYNYYSQVRAEAVKLAHQEATDFAGRERLIRLV